MCEKHSLVQQIRRAGVAFGAILAALSTRVAPASAASCATVSACVFGSNTHSTPLSGFGADAGVAGSSLNGDGVDGATHFASTAATGKSGVAGFDMSKTGTHNSGVFGFSALGVGVHGTSSSGSGVAGVATSAKGAGVRAEGRALALEASVVNGTALSVHDTSNLNYVANTGIAVQVLGDGIKVGTDFGNFSLDVFAGPMTGNGATVDSAGGDALDILQEPNGNSGAIPLFISGGNQDSVLVAGALALDSSGNLTIAGSLTQNGTPMSVTRTSSGRSLTTYASREAEATIEDVGETTVTNGRATVVLDASFASTLDQRRPYYVFLTAEGDNRGLYVTSKNPRGFSIRETNGGTSTLNVAYRIVAQPYDAAGSARLAAVTGPMPYANASVAAHVAAMKRRVQHSKNALPGLRPAQATDGNVQPARRQ